MDQPDSLTLSNLGKKYSISTTKLLEMYEEADTLPMIEPARVTYISRLLYYMCSGLVTDGRNQFVLNHNKFLQQSEINESIQTYKASSNINNKGYPYDKEKALITKLKTGDTEGLEGAEYGTDAFYASAEGRLHSGNCIPWYGVLHQSGLYGSCSDYDEQYFAPLWCVVFLWNGYSIGLCGCDFQGEYGFYGNLYWNLPGTDTTEESKDK